MTLPAKLILFLCFIGCFPPGQAINISTDYADLRAVYVRYGHELYPFAIFHDGESVINYSDWGGNIWYYTTGKVFALFENHLKNDTFYGYTDHPDNERRILSFNDLYPQTELNWSSVGEDFDPSILPGIVTNDPSPDFMADARYTAYTVAEQDKVPEVYCDYIRRRLYTDGLTDTPLIIKEVWEFDFDGDGKDEAFIVANNALDRGKRKTAEIAEPEMLTTADGVGFYSYKLFYSETFLPIDIEVTASSMHETFSSGEGKICDVLEPLYEYDEDGQIRLFNTWWDEDDLYFEDSTQPPAPFDLAICDLNGDGLYDFLYLNYTSIYAPYIFYLQSPDGDFIRTGGMYTSA